ncbi:MAG TPA: hypothetical protein VFC36_06940 [Paludibacter sp.]|nr:hypothetical protein [Paludibacter sp.]
MKKSYTLNEFFRSAQKLIDKYNGAEAGHALEVSFEIGERKGSPVLDCKIKYAKEYEYKFYASATTPESAILIFEKDILRTKGESYLEDLTVEIPDRTTYELIPSKV